MSVPTVKIDGTPVSVLAAGSMNNTNAFGITDQVEQRSTASFTIKDDAGTTHYQQGQQVEILAADGSTLFWGYIDVPTESRVIGPTNTPYLRTGCTCKDGIYWADKRVAAKAYTNTLAGDIVSDLVKSYLAAEGVVGYHVSRTESTQSDWQQGTYLLNPGFEGTYVSGVAPGWTTFATSATGVTWSQDASGHTGVAEKVTIANNPTTTGNIGISQNVPVVVGQTYTFGVWVKIDTAFSGVGTIILTMDWYNGSSVYLSSSAQPSIPSGSTTGWVWFSTSGTAPATAASVTLALEIWPNNLTNSGALSLDDATFFATTIGGATLNPNLLAAPNSLTLAKVGADTSASYQTLADFASGTLSTTQAPGDPDLANTRTYLRDWNDNTATSQTLFGASGCTQVVTAGACTLTPASGQDARSRLDAVAKMADFWLSVDIVIPSSGNAGVVYRTTGWQNNNETYGYAVKLTTTQLIFGYGSNSSSGTGTFTTLLTYTLGSSLTGGSTHRLRIVVQGSKHSFWLDGVQQATTQTDSTYMAAGQFGLRASGAAATFDNLVIAPLISQLDLAGYRADWSSEAYLFQQSLFGSSGTTGQQTISNSQLQVTCAANKQVYSRFNNQAAIADFTAEFDVVVPSGSGTAGLIYRTTHWAADSANDTYAYLVYVGSGTINLGRGTNSSTGGFTLIQQVAVAGLTSGSTHRIKVVVSGSSHTVYVDGVSKISQTDATFNAAGQFALYHGDTSATAAVFGNVGIVPAESGTWVSPVINPSGASLAGATAVSWTASTPPSTSVTVQVQVSTDGGATYGALTSCTNGAAIPGITALENLTNVRLKFTVTLSTTDATVTPTFSLLTASIASAYVSGTQQRISPALDLSAADIARTATVTWDATIPAGTTLLIETSIDHGATWQMIAASGDEIPGLQYEPSPYDDIFDSDTSALFSQSGGATWTWETMDNVLQGSNAAGSSGDGLLLYSGLSPTDVILAADSSQADDLSLLARVNGTTYYRLRIQDSSTPNAAVMTLYKVVSGVSTSLGTANVDFQPGDLHRMELEIIGTALTASLDSTPILTASDSTISGAGQCGLLLARPGSGTNLATLEWLHVEPHGQSLAGVSVLVRQSLTADANRDATPTLQDLTIKACTRTIQDGPTIVQASLNYAYITDCINALATAATFTWNIRPDHRLVFQARALTAAAWAIWTNSAGLAPDMLGSPEPTVQNANPLYRNREIITGGLATTALQVEEQLGDGSRQTFTVGFPLVQAPVVLEVNGVAQTVGLKGTDTGKDWYWAPGDNTLAQDNGGTPLTSADLWHIEYYGQYQATTISESPAAIADRQSVEGGGTGIVEMVDDGSDLTDQSAAFQRAAAILQRYGVIGRTLTFETRRAGLVAGTLLRVKLPVHNLNNVLMLISSVRTYDLATELRYQITAVEGPVIGSWTQLFANLISKIPSNVASLSVGSSGIVAIEYSVPESRTRAESVTETVYVCPIIGPSTLCGPAVKVC